MFYRVDYMLAVLFIGFVLGFMLSRTTEYVLPGDLVRTFYAITAILLFLRAALFACTMLWSHQNLSTTLGGVVGDTLSLIFGALFGLALRRKDAREILTSSAIFSALCMFLAFIFAIAGIGKAFSMTPMTEFFTQSGYSVSFLKFIVIAEIFAALGLLIPWAVLPSLVGLTIDMFGAVLTHIHNGDPLNDSTGAIGMLIRLVIVGALWQLRRRNSASPHNVCNSILGVGAAAGVCLLIAICGGAVMRHAGAISSISR
jgi:uncharacterized membrane protein YphA (DoxX/SURF4 family)